MISLCLYIYIYMIFTSTVLDPACPGRQAKAKEHKRLKPGPLPFRCGFRVRVSGLGFRVGVGCHENWLQRTRAWCSFIWGCSNGAWRFTRIEYGVCWGPFAPKARQPLASKAYNTVQGGFLDRFHTWGSGYVALFCS